MTNRLLPLGLLMVLCACGGVRPPAPPAPPPSPPPPQPVCDPPCGSGARCVDDGLGPRCTPPDQTFLDLGLHVVGGAFIQLDSNPLDFRGAKACCTSENGEPDPKWPLVSDAFMDYAKTQGNVNFVGVRLGPWRAVAGGEDGQANLGGAYLEVTGKADLSQWNPAFWARIVAIHEHAGSLGQRVENSLIDGWAMKQHCLHGSQTYHPWIPQNNVQGIDACDAQMPGNATQEVWIRKVVAETGKFHNGVYEISNEGILVPTSPAWERWVISIVRDEEAKHGFPRHLIGSDAMTTEADFGIVHQNSEPASSQCAGKPCVNSEYNPTPAFSPAQLYGLYCAAKARGTYLWYWRHEQSKAAMDDTLARIKGGCAGGCAIPTTDVPRVTPRPAGGSTRDALIDEAEAFVKAKHPELFDATGNLAGWPSDGKVQAAYAQRYFNPLVDYLRGKGYCASAWEDSIAVGRPSDGFYEEWHILTFGHGRPVSGAEGYLLTPDHKGFTWNFPAALPSPTPNPTPPPPEIPPPGPVPTPAPGACPIAAPGDSWAFDLKPEGGKLLDGTPWVGNPTHTKDQPWVGCGVNRCPLACEKGDLACSCQHALFGDPIWGPGGACKLVQPEGASKFTIKIAEGACALFVKGSAGTSQLGPWGVSATVPACHVGADGLCQ